jgi:hypothetical protein
MFSVRCLWKTSKIVSIFPLKMTDTCESKYFTNSRLTRSKIVKNVDSVSDTDTTFVTSDSETTVRVKVEPVENSVHDLKKEQPNNISIGKKRKGKKEKTEIKYETENSVDVKKEKWEPPIWRKQLKNMYEMRKNRDAPVDSMGCDVISDVTAKPEVCLQQSKI